MFHVWAWLKTPLKFNGPSHRMKADPSYDMPFPVCTVSFQIIQMGYTAQSKHAWNNRLAFNKTQLNSQTREEAGWNLPHHNTTSIVFASLSEVLWSTRHLFDQTFYCNRIIVYCTKFIGKYPSWDLWFLSNTVNKWLFIFFKWMAFILICVPFIVDVFKSNRGTLSSHNAGQ